ncbi:alkaline phosphatase D family protein [Flagellimonas nanhaiensis]|uniref:Alkaline phosphatase family protein n=1 Tax=Flagellimonas nanhaiensis TaxID=2292706 RepID=A0A371JTE6_9FLAO|nr:alkaline phosphatase D family protein [Allomuricauda nanhaiensis]RDY61067.1 alkaline phosphatase family protein [Allomuricauda nanhaiensis]
MKYNLLFFSIIGLMVSCKSVQTTSSEKTSLDSDNSTFVVSFGSCNKQYMPNPYWDDILAEAPDVWIWGGDNIYADTDDMDLLKKMYNEQDSNEGYALLKSKVPVVGTWDDHDYGLNDGGKEFRMKRESQQVFLDFMGVPADSERRTREGVYASHLFETPNGKVQILALDTRYFRGELLGDRSPNRRYGLNTASDATVLGAEQWKWLENKLTTSKADFNLIVSSIQFLSREHGFETWGNFPKEVEKLERMIAKSGAEGVIILSGDRHISEFSRTNLSGMSYPLVDFTSSGLTHSYSSFKEEPNRFRVGDVVSSTSYGILELDFKNREAHFKIMGENGLVLQELKQSY